MPSYVWPLCLLVIVVTCSVAAASSSVTLSVGHLPHSTIFFPDEPVRFRVVVVADSRSEFKSPMAILNVIDVDGKQVAESQVEVHRTIQHVGFFNVDLGLLPPGWYRVDVGLVDGQHRYETRNEVLPTQESHIPLAVIERPVPGPLPNSYFGIAEHQLSDLDAAVMQRAGMRWMRVDTFWSDMQRHENSPLDWHRFDGIVNKAQEYGIEILPIIDYGVGWASAHQPEDPRQPPKSEPWIAYVSALADRYHDRIGAWEIWNEPNIGQFFLGTPADYGRLLNEAYSAIKAIDPHATVAAAGTSGVDRGWYRQMLTADETTLDVLAVHPYRQPAAPERGVLADLVNFRLEMCDLLQSDSEYPLWITEMGYHTSADRAVPEHRQAQYVVRAMVEAWAAGVSRFFWYEFADGHQNAADPEANFGLVYHDRSPKPALVAYATLERQLGQATYQGRLLHTDRRIRAYLFDTPSGPVVATWSLSGIAEISWPDEGSSAAAVLTTDLFGRQQVLVPTSGQYRVSITENPQYVQLGTIELLLTSPDIRLTDNPLETGADVASPMAVNLVQNPSFEITNSRGLPADWQVQIAGGAQFTYEHVAPNRNTPVSCMRLTNATPLKGHVFGRIYQSIPVQPFSVYTVSALVRTRSNQRAWIGGGPDWAVRIALPVDTNGQWQRVHGVITTYDETEWPLMILLEDIDELVEVTDVRFVEGIEPSSGEQ